MLRFVQMYSELLRGLCWSVGTSKQNFLALPGFTSLDWAVKAGWNFHKISQMSRSVFQMLSNRCVIRNDSCANRC